MITVKLSHSILSAWAMGRQEDAIGMYLGKDLPASPAMELGKAMDEIWNKQINDTKVRPLELGGGELNNPVTQQKYRKVIPFSDQYQILLSGVPDCVDGNVIDEHKCGRTTAGDYIEKFQLDYYKLLVPEATIGVYRCWNPYLKQLTVGVKFLGDWNAEQAINHIITYGGEMIEYLASQRLLTDYKEPHNGRQSNPTKPTSGGAKHAADRKKKSRSHPGQAGGRPHNNT